MCFKVLVDQKQLIKLEQLKKQLSALNKQEQEIMAEIKKHGSFENALREEMMTSREKALREEMMTPKEAASSSGSKEGSALAFRSP